VGVEEQVAPDRLELLRVAPDQPRRQVVAQQRDDGRAAGADGVGVAGANRAIAAAHGDEHRLLRDEGLDGVGAPHFRRDVDLRDLDLVDLAKAHDDAARQFRRRCA
jgi:hypothetical protein